MTTAETHPQHTAGLFDRLVLSSLPLVPTPLMRRLASRYIAGEELADALVELAKLRDRGHPGILDILGEGITSEAEAKGVLEQYTRAASAVVERDLDAYVSVKPTHFGLTISEDLALENYRSLARHCRDLSLFLRVEMEDHPTTDATLRIFARLREEFDDVGIVLQARLRRTPADIETLPPRSNVRMVKGIYLEPPAIAHVDADVIRQAYVDCSLRLLELGGFLGLATHDDGMAREITSVIAERGIHRDAYEFQVLLGVREPLWSRWVSEGHSVRVYVPYGPQWRAYSQRRMSKNPELLRSIIRNTLRLG